MCLLRARDLRVKRGWETWSDTREQRLIRFVAIAPVLLLTSRNIMLCFRCWWLHRGRFACSTSVGGWGLASLM